MNSVLFLKPRLTGERFEGAVIPLEVLADFVVLEEMVVEVAKWKYRQSNQERKRVPRGFTDGMSLRLTGIEPGSAIPIISLFVATNTLFPLSAQTYFDEARTAIIGAIGAAERGTPITEYLPQQLLGYFDRFGRNLGDGEAIEFDQPGMPIAKLTRETRRKLVLASSAEEVTEELVVYGLVPEVNQRVKSFQILTLNGTTLTNVPLDTQHHDTVMEASNGYRDGMRIRLFGVGSFSRSNKLQRVVSVEHISVLDPLDIEARIEELKLLKAGWLDGKGLAPSHGGLDWLSGAFELHFPDDVPLPYLYPTAEGGVRAEWTLRSYELSLELDLRGHQGAWHELNTSDDSDDAVDLSLQEPAGWQWLVTRIRQLAEVSR